MSKKEQRERNYRDIFRREHEILSKAEKLSSQESPEPSELREGFAALTRGFQRLLDTASKMTRIGDSVQRQLVDTQRELRKALREKEELNKHLTELAAEKDEYLGFAAHDLRNPLSNVIMGLEMMQDHVEMSREEWQGIVSDSTDECRRMLELLSNLLDVNRIETGSMVWEIREFCPREAASLVVENFRKRAEKKEQTIEFDEPEEPISAMGDPQAYLQILENLISNALKYSPVGSVTRVSFHRSVGFLRTEVRDEGPGLTSEDHKNLFGKFARLSARPTGGENSVGLGLAIVKSLAEAMHGRVGCWSKLGEGSVFYFEIPVHEQ
ncbi:ATP-binding protein [Puniceicoccus vermicola]|uniref:histidine kinase n=1 Tax=Puniceicoccus vermicola TaxID=388746 RepID=A0A7X1E300_9BACT|nr:HAMP domain-containing histidine kinase [Puniceicoccus vermicola]